MIGNDNKTLIQLQKDMEVHRAQLESELETLRDYIHEIPTYFRNFDNELVDISCSISYIKSQSEEIDLTIGVIKDIKSELKALEMEEINQKVLLGQKEFVKKARAGNIKCSCNFEGPSKQELLFDEDDTLHAYILCHHCDKILAKTIMPILLKPEVNTKSGGNKND